MPSAFIPSRLGYSAMPLVRQQIHQRSVHPGPLVLRTAPLKYLAPTTDRDRTVSRRSEPSSRTALMGEQTNPWELLHPQDAMHIIIYFYMCRLYLHPPINFGGVRRIIGGMICPYYGQPSYLVLANSVVTGSKVVCNLNKNKYEELLF